MKAKPSHKISSNTLSNPGSGSIRKTDCNAYLGQWPFRETRYTEPASLIELMDSMHITQACVTPVNGLFYKDVHRANLQLSEMIKEYRTRLLPFCVINPFYPGWKEDLQTCVDRLGAKAIALYPSLHNYSLQSPQCGELLTLLGSMHIPAALSERIEDERGEHWHFKIPNIKPDEIIRTVQNFPKTKFIIRDAFILNYEKLSGKNWLIDFSRTDITLSHANMKWVKKSIDRFTFGTQMPLKTPLPAIYKIEKSDMDAKLQKKIFSENLLKFLSR